MRGSSGAAAPSVRESFLDEFQNFVPTINPADEKLLSCQGRRFDAPSSTRSKTDVGKGLLNEILGVKKTANWRCRRWPRGANSRIDGGEGGNFNCGWSGITARSRRNRDCQSDTFAFKIESELEIVEAGEKNGDAGDGSGGRGDDVVGSFDALDPRAPKFLADNPSIQTNEITFLLQ